MITFDPTVKLGDIFTIGAFLGVGITAYYGIKTKIAEVAATQKHMGATYDLRLNFIDATLENARVDLKNSSTQDAMIAQQRKEIDALWGKLNELSHWKGFVNPSGEYRRDSGPKLLSEG